jgi:hypothetical protein
VKSLLVVADYVSVNPDGTFGMLRGGLSRLQMPSLPGVVSLGFLIRITGEFGEEGAHDFKLLIVDYDGKSIAKAEGTFHITPDQRLINMGINMPLNLINPGRISARLVLDKQLAADWTLEIVLPLSPKPQSPDVQL